MRNLTMLILNIAVFFNAAISFANWEISLSYQYDNRGYKLDKISNSPRTGIGFEFGYQFPSLNEEIDLITALEYISQSNTFEKSYNFGFPNFKADDSITRFGFITYLTFSSYWFEPYIGISTGIELYTRSNTFMPEVTDIGFREEPNTRDESNLYICSLIGFQTNIVSFFNPFFDLRYYSSFHSYEGYSFDQKSDSKF